MALWQELLSDDVGRMSLAVIVFVVMMGGYFLRMFIHKMNNNE
ncbi:MAG: DUF3149 domain-containing protein [Neisseriaceae bacterium]|jgi:hypothetical protein|nr:hypothetical protein [Pseudomonadota bacterium]RTL02525.1 MAG: DUF3149 domain-containing protein [Neisseriaceae bacterium]